ncbi:Proline dehydrogenase 1 [Austwickia sp. TVS 96-490-7B]|uniref:proline dehydrogenase family protein n=1 Tax=Austwickia sp. TVS 96-490-7B TaxID=2830843 RepID=UPI001C57C65B|nr:proline dehydrogenase family protein [Austwickia sp. TVS 96-490-7B]MBW3084793.1 Proline dehydrogenase 1 [Austwickia sp. TVS 96-490-7B]
MPNAKAMLSASLRRVARERRLRRLAEAPTMSRELVRRFVAGETIASAVEVSAELVLKRRHVCLTSLQPVPEDAQAAIYHARRYRTLLRRLGESGLASEGRCEVSFALADIGMAIGVEGPDLALTQARKICQAAANAGALVTVETIHADDVDLTVETVAELRQDFPGVGISLQAALRRTASDVREQQGHRVRLVKGPPGTGDDRYRHPAEVDRSFARSARVLLANPGTPVLSTQDLRLIEIVEALARHVDRPRGSYEYQLRYGVRPEMQAVIGDRGDLCRVYTPFGQDWYAYLISRVADDPSKVGDLLKAAFAR